MIDNVILLYSEITKGMKSYGPKAFIPVGNQYQKTPLVIKQIENIWKTYSTKTKIYIVVGFEQDRLIKILDEYYPNNSNIIKVYHNNYEFTNNAYASVLAIQQISQGNVLIIQNGILTNYSPKNLDRSILPILKDNNNNNNFNIGVTKNQDRVEYVFYDLEHKWSELLFISKKDLTTIKTSIDYNSIEEKFLFEFINVLIDSNICFETEFVAKSRIQKINSHKDKI